MKETLPAYENQPFSSATTLLSNLELLQGSIRSGRKEIDTKIQDHRERLGSSTWRIFENYQSLAFHNNDGRPDLVIEMDSENAEILDYAFSIRMYLQQKYQSENTTLESVEADYFSRKSLHALDYYSFEIVRSGFCLMEVERLHADRFSQQDKELMLATYLWSLGVDKHDIASALGISADEVGDYVDVKIEIMLEGSKVGNIGEEEFNIFFALINRGKNKRDMPEQVEISRRVLQFFTIGDTERQEMLTVMSRGKDEGRAFIETIYAQLDHISSQSHGVNLRDVLQKLRDHPDNKDLVKQYEQKLPKTLVQAILFIAKKVS